MSILVASLIFLVSLLIGFLVFVVFLLNQNRKFLLATQEAQLKILHKQMDATNLLLQRALALLSTKDPLAYQAVVAMETAPSSFSEPVGMSDAEEAERWLAEHPEGEDLDDSLDRDALRELGNATGQVPTY